MISQFLLTRLVVVNKESKMVSDGFEGASSVRKASNGDKLRKMGGKWAEKYAKIQHVAETAGVFNLF